MSAQPQQATAQASSKLIDAMTCNTCGESLNAAQGITRIDGGNQPGVYCHYCVETSGHGYTIADLERMRAETQVARATHDMRVMDQLGVDVYFAVADDR